MPAIKVAAAHFAKNFRMSKAVTMGMKYLGTRQGGAMLGRMAAFGGAGGLYGIADNLMGDRVSVLGGMAQGAMIGMGFHGLRSAWGARRGGMALAKGFGGRHPNFYGNLLKATRRGRLGASRVGTGGQYSWI